MSSSSRTTVLEVSGVQWASQQAVAEMVLSRRPGVTAVDVNPVAQTATVTYDPRVTSVAGVGRLGARLRLSLCGTTSTRATSAIRWLNRARHRQSSPSSRAAQAPHPAPTAHDGHDVHAGHACARRARCARSSRRDDRAGRHGPRRSPRWHVHGRDGRRHASALPRRCSAVGAHPALVSRSALRFSVSRLPHRSVYGTMCSRCC